ncbi:MAG: hypothetical protein WCI18_15900 [Pseudomonadota bacterium]
MKIKQVAVMIALLSGCRTDSDVSSPQALSSNDWFKTGVDRFYLAWIKTDAFISPSHQELFGQQFFLGVGCYGEEKDGSKEVSVRNAPHSDVYITKKLNERVMLHEFDIVPKSSTPKPGQCKILLGDVDTAQQISNVKSMTAGGKAGAAALVFGSSGFVCMGSLLQTVKFVGLAGAAMFSTSATAGAAAPFAVPPLLGDGVATGASLVGCGAAAVGATNTRLNYMTSENKKLFASSLLEASELANTTLKADKILFSRYNSLRRAFATMDVAAAIWNPIFVREFNHKVNQSFENGWFTSEKFFDAVRSIQTETLNSFNTVR